MCQAERPLDLGSECAEPRGTSISESQDSCLSAVDGPGPGHQSLTQSGSERQKCRVSVHFASSCRTNNT